MLKIIKKALLLASFVFSSVFPMRQVAQIALENIFPKKQVAQVMLARTLNQSVFVHNSLAAKSSVIASIAILAKNIEAKAMFTEDIFLGLFESVANDCKKNGTRDQIYHDLKNGHSFIVMNGANWQGSSESGAPTCGCSSQLGSTNFTGSSSVDMVHQGLLSGNSLEAEEHLFKIEHNAQRQEMQEEYFENVKKQVNFISANYSTIIQNKTAELVKSCSLSSRQELLDKKWDLANRLTDLEKRFEYLKEKNVHVKYIFDIAPTNNPHHSHGSIYCDIKENLPDKEYFEVLEAIWLKTNIESIKAAMQECDWRIFRFEQEARDSISSKLENEFIDTIEKEITDLATNKGKIACYVAQKENDLNKLKNSLYKIENELEYFYKERTWVDRFFNKSTINSFWNKDNALKEQIAQMSQDLQILKDSQKKCEVQIEQAQKIVQGKIKIASQESQILQEKQEQEAIALYEQSVRSHQSLGDFYSANEEERNDLKEALSETIKQNYMSYDQQYNLTPQTAGFLAVNGIDYKDFLGFNGTALQ
ncbi:MAG TPA: hypothetical protein VLG50_01990, partial [Candidatus Saccharimonadales bacterium]|nr:hypothetical protein [Candidatus Saccharimonadales bacterium]